MKLADIKVGEQYAVSPDHVRRALAREDTTGSRVTTLPDGFVYAHGERLADRVLRLERRGSVRHPTAKVLAVRVPYRKGKHGIRIELTARASTECDYIRRYGGEFIEAGPEREVPASTIAATVHFSALLSEDDMIAAMAEEITYGAEREAKSAVAEDEEMRRLLGDPEVLRKDVQAEEAVVRDYEQRMTWLTARITLFRRLHDSAVQGLREIGCPYNMPDIEDADVRAYLQARLTRWERDPCPEISAIIRAEERDLEHYRGYLSSAVRDLAEAATAAELAGAFGEQEAR